ncbi:MAG: translation initiation factor eIF-1A [Candidatus Micrarchaeota archaeon]
MYRPKRRPYKRPYKPQNQEQTVSRVRLPRESEREVLGIVIGMMGGSRMLVQCKDGKERMCRMPGRLKNQIWVRDGDAVIVQEWELEGDKKGDIIWRYKPIEVRWLRDRNFI